MIKLHSTKFIYTHRNAKNHWSPKRVPFVDLPKGISIMFYSPLLDMQTETLMALG